MGPSSFRRVISIELFGFGVGLIVDGHQIDQRDLGVFLRGGKARVAQQLLDGAEIGESSVVAALSFVKAGMFVPPHMLVAGIPGRLVRELTEEEVAIKTKGTGIYQMLAKRSLASMRTCEALTQPEPNRRRFELPRFDPPAKELHDLFASGGFRQP